MELATLDLIPSPDFQGIRLERPIKKQLVVKSQDIHSSAKQIGMRYNLSHHPIKKYRSMVLRGLPMFKYDGRPSKLDTEGVNFILIKC